MRRRQLLHVYGDYRLWRYIIVDTAGARACSSAILRNFVPEFISIETFDFQLHLDSFCRLARTYRGIRVHVCRRIAGAA
jgi:hypothetical protein